MGQPRHLTGGPIDTAEELSPDHDAGADRDPDLEEHEGIAIDPRSRVAARPVRRS